MRSWRMTTSQLEDTMHRRGILNFSIVTAAAVALLPGTALAQSLKDQVVGSWMLEAGYNILPDGSRLEANGPSPEGMIVFESRSRFAQQIIDSTLPKFASNNRQQGTPEEFKRVAQGVIAYFGTYTVDDNQNITMRVDYSSYANMNGTAGKREVKITGDEMQIINKSAPSGGVAYLIWRRAK